MKKPTRDEYDEKPNEIVHRPTEYRVSRHPGRSEPAFERVVEDEAGYDMGEVRKLATVLLTEQWEREKE